MSSQGPAHRATSRQAVWPVLSGPVPPPAPGYVPRQEAGPGAADGLAPGETMVLAPADDAAARSLGGLGGTGKTATAAALAHDLWERQEVDLLLWLSPSDHDAVLTGYAQALRDVGEPDAGGGPEAAAHQFLRWLATTERPWLVVLDDLTDPAAMEGLWPSGPKGRVVVTTPRADTTARANNPRVVEIGLFSAREALAYLSARLGADPDQRIGAVDVGNELGLLPIALAQAAALMTGAGIDCRNFRSLVAERKRMTGGLADAYPSILAATWSLAVELADQVAPGLARPMLSLLAMLDSHGIPGAVLTSRAALAYLTRSRGAGAVDELQARGALHNLAQMGLVSIDAGSAARTVRIHPLVQATIRQNLSAAAADVAARVAADALVETWPRPGLAADFSQAFRDCTWKLREITGRLLWAPDCHAVLLRAGMSLDAAGLAGPAITYWQGMLDTSRQLLGPGHLHTLLARDRLAGACETAGRLDQAISTYENALADRERMLSPGHPDILATRNSLVRAYRLADRGADAIRVAERTLAESEDMLGPAHPQSLAAQSELGHSHLSAGRADDAVAAFQRTLAGREHVLGPAHADTLTARGHLALALRAAGRFQDAIRIYERTVADRERLQGRDHLDALTARGDLASAYRSAGALKDAVSLCRRTLADRERVQGADHPDTIAARANLANALVAAKKVKHALALYEQALAGREQVQGPDHPDTITARGDLASAYRTARKLTRAIPLYERTLADCERVLGPGHPDTLACRGNLADAYYSAGRRNDGLAMLKRAVDDSEQALGSEHPLTQTAREKLQAATR